MTMNKFHRFGFLCLTIAALTGCNGGKNDKADTNTTTDMTTTQTEGTSQNDILVDISTTMGDIQVRLYGDTPGHRDNFAKLAEEGYYDGTLFHRVINDFMVQAGDPDSRTAPAGKMLGEGDPGYTLAAEIDYPHHYHKRGALAAARTGDNVNPERRSSGSQFYIVTGKVFNDSTLNQMERNMKMQQVNTIFQQLAQEKADKVKELRKNRDQAGLQKLQEELIAEAEKKAAANPATLAEEVRQDYTTIGGTPHLDGAYTVFGEVTKGMDVVDKIQKVETDGNDRPKEDVRIVKMKVVK